MTNIDTKENVQMDRTRIEKVINYKYLGQTTAMENRARQEVFIKIKAGWSVFGKDRVIFLDGHLPMSLNRKVFNQCVLPAMTYGCQTWSLLLQPVCLTSNGIWMPNMVSYKSISKET